MCSKGLVREWSSITGRVEGGGYKTGGGGGGEFTPTKNRGGGGVSAMPKVMHKRFFGSFDMVA